MKYLRQFLLAFAVCLGCLVYGVTAMYLVIGTLMPPFEPGEDLIRDWEANHVALCLTVGFVMIVAGFAAIGPVLDWQVERSKRMEKSK